MGSKRRKNLSGTQIQRQVFRRLKKYQKLTFLEQFAMYVGKAQILELGLKSLLTRRYGYDPEQIEKWTLGYVSRELKESGLRQDFIMLLERVVKQRNYIAHDLLVSEAMLRRILGRDPGRLEKKHLYNSIYELEQVIFLYDWCEEYNAWGEVTPPNRSLKLREPPE